ncbi:MAG: hypothetical protein ETSY1_28680 [Candidatus Entotheonella factor]|uniref:Phytase-like domain-containing protein n=1 Tax=Entotheonella factor TaxID=1429438 RepID=W4LDA9_ENTF1|nr:MAG: hypothetical protein ETSY1_28680 [Candidatus Entotheonella factor]
MQTMKMICNFAIIFIFFNNTELLQAQDVQPQLMLFKSGIALPDGTTIDSQGRVIVHSEAFRTTEVIQFNADGELLAQVSFGDGVFDKTRFIGSRFSYDPLLNLIIMLTPEGNLFQIHPDGLQVLPDVLSIPPEAIGINDVYDINTGQLVSFGLSLDTVMRYGDLALFRPELLPAQPKWVITGTAERLSEPPLPFVMELTIDSLSGAIAAQLMLISSAASFTMAERTRGVAVNEHGIGLTTLPITDPLNPDETREVAVAFSVYTASNMPDPLPQPAILYNALDVTSDGMASDAAGHFYAASGDQGSSACDPHRSGALVVMPVDANGLPLGLTTPVDVVPAAPAPLGILEPLACIPIATTMDDIVSSRDIAVSPMDQSVIITINNQDAVLIIFQP